MPIQIAQPAAVKEESETVKWVIGKIYTEKSETQQPDQLMATTNCAPVGQSPSRQGLKLRISKQKRA